VKSRRFWRLLAIALIGAVGGTFRLYALDRLPPGLHYDEAFNNLMALRVWQGMPLPIFFPENYGSEPLHMALIWLLFRVVGPTALGGRLVSAVSGTLTVMSLAFAVREIFYQEVGPRRATHLGLLASLALAVLYWHTHYSRLGMEASMVPTLAVPAFGFIWRALRTRRSSDAILGGLFLGGVPYTYPASRFVPLVPILFFGALALADHRFFQSNKRVLTTTTLVALLVFAPAGWAYAQNPSWFLGRASMVAGHSIPELARTLSAVLKGFYAQGDLNPRQNLPGRPIFDTAQGALFALGLVVCLAKRRRPHCFVLCWLGVMVLPSALTEYAPHFGRMLGAAPAVGTVIGIGALGFWDIVTAVVREFPREPWARAYARTVKAAAAAALGVAFAFSGFRTASDYLVSWGQSPDLFPAFDVGPRWVGELAAALPENERIFLSPIGWDHYTIRFFIHDRSDRIQSFNGRRCLVYPSHTDEPANFIIVVAENEDPYSLAEVQEAFPDGRIEEDLSSGQKPWAVVYRVPVGSIPRTEPQHAMDVSFDNSVRLLGYDTPEGSARPGDTLKVRLYWQSDVPLSQTYKSFVHLYQSPTPESAGQIVGQEDAQPCDNSYPYAWWVPGDIVAEDRWIPVSPEAPPGEAQLLVGMYREDGNRLLASDGQGEELGDHVILTSVEIPS